MTETEGATVYGRGPTSSSDPDATTNYDSQSGGSAGDCEHDLGGGMATYSFHTMLVSLHIHDTPLSYTPPRGPSIPFTITYNSLEANQPAGFSYSNLGSHWTINWLSYITDDPKNPGADVDEYVSGGGTVSFSGYNGASSSYAPEMMSHSILKITSSTSYQLTFPDGSRQIYSQPDGATAFPRRVFLTQIIDPHGNNVTLSYDFHMRIASITDALSQATTFSYGLAGDIYKITSVADPFGRTASFSYDTNMRLIASTDVIGIQSHFTYDNTGFISKLTTPYGDTAFTTGATGSGSSRINWIQATDALGATERLEFNERNDVGVPDSEPAQVLPQGMHLMNNYKSYRNTFFWSKKAWHDFPNDHSKAHLTHWLNTSNVQVVSRVPESEKAPYENRVSYDYPDQTNPQDPYIHVGSSNLPTSVGRVLDDGSTQLWKYEYNPLGHPTKTIDPLGRTTLYTYDTNIVDLLKVQQVNPATGSNDLLASFTYDLKHNLQTATDASGQTTAWTYNSAGQVTSVTDAKNNKTTFTYNASGYLLSVVGPLGAGGNDTVSYSCDAYGRVRTFTDTQGYTRTYAYDAMDRVTSVTYPDSTTDSFTYNKLDLVARTDRLGRTTLFTYDALRHRTQVRDPLNRTTYLNYCPCGALEGIVDPLGRATFFQYDAQTRLIAKIYPDGSTEQYAYAATTSRLKSKTDPMGQVTNYQYYVDGNVHRVIYSNCELTPGVTFTYDPVCNRIASMSDGSGLTTFTYNPVTATPALGANRLASVNGPLPNSLIAYSYDELGRLVSRSINGVAQTVLYDQLSRVTRVTNPPRYIQLRLR